MSAANHPKRVGSTARSVYVSLLRRAFLLRVHPDRFRNHVDSVRQQQATLVKALSHRMSENDFLSWQSSLTSTSPRPQFLPITNSDTYAYVLEKRDGTLISTRLNLAASVDEILKEMSNALTMSGATAPQVPHSSDGIDFKQNTVHSHDNSEQVNGTRQSIHFYGSSDDIIKEYNIDRKYDLVSNRGRNLKAFLMESGGVQDKISDDKILTMSDMIHDRRSSRTDAQAAALTVRKAFKFQSIDATRTGWSSSSVAILLRRLRDLHKDHSKDFNVSSFYPLRLVFTPKDFADEQGVTYPEAYDGSIPASDVNNSNLFDVYSGELRLHPAWTSSQWLKVLCLVTSTQLENVKKYRNLADERTKMVQELLGIKIRKGHSCSSWEYHSFLERISSSISSSKSKSELGSLDQFAGSISTYNATIALQTDSLVTATVESSYSVRRAGVTKEGVIRFGSMMDMHDCLSALEQLIPKARDISSKHEVERIKCKQTISQVQQNLGLQKVYLASPLVTQTQFNDSLNRILNLIDTTVVKGSDKEGRAQEDFLQPSEHEFIKYKLAGNSLGIASDGHFCHLADDGSVVIPHNWVYSSN